MGQVVKCAFCGFEDPSACSENPDKVFSSEGLLRCASTGYYGVSTNVAQNRVREFLSLGNVGNQEEKWEGKAYTQLEATLATRGSRYGEFPVNARIAQDLKDIFRKSPKWKSLEADQREALDIIASKISRLLTGDPNYPDNWHDIQGFAKLVEDRLDK